MIEKNVFGFKVVIRNEDGFAYRSKSKGLYVIQSEGIELDDRRWIHTSYSRQKRIPTYDDTAFIKKHFIGELEKAIMIFPKESEHVNIHPFCLHLWHCLDEDILPDFTHGTGSI